MFVVDGIQQHTICVYVYCCRNIEPMNERNGDGNIETTDKTSQMLINNGEKS